MPRRRAALVLRGKPWRLDFRHQGQRYQARLGRNISRTVTRRVEAGWCLKRGKGTRSRLRTAFTNACQRANLSDVTPHTLRHTFAFKVGDGRDK
jgi:integrase